MRRSLRDFMGVTSFVTCMRAKAQFNSLLQAVRDLLSPGGALRVSAGGILLLAIFALTVPPVALAENPSVEVTETEAAVGKIVRKLVRGIVNILTGWLEFPVQIYKVSATEGVLHGASHGLLMGVGMTVVRTGAGVIDTALFLIPLPEDYGPLLKPEFVWSRHEEEETASSLIRKRAFACLPDRSSTSVRNSRSESAKSYSTEAKTRLLHIMEFTTISTSATIFKTDGAVRIYHENHQHIEQATD